MSIRPVNYAKLTSEQIAIISKYYDEGMKSTTCSEQIEKAATEALLHVDKVKVRNWFRNDRATLAIVVSYDRPEDISRSKFDRTIVVWLFYRNRRSREQKVISCCVL